MNKNLSAYHRKRDFSKTKEPSGNAVADTGVESKSKKKMSQNSQKRKFVIQYHLARREHYDFRLEWRGVLLSWAVPKGPSFNPKDKRLAVHVEDHPLDYADFEGIIPKGQYGGGTVMLWDDGYWEPIGDIDEGLQNGSIKMRLFGQRLHGQWALVRLQKKDNDRQENWLLIKDKDEYSQEKPGISAFQTSVKTGMTASQIGEEKDVKNKTHKAKVGIRTSNPFFKAEVQVPTLVDEVPDGEEWLYEVKYDGYRILAYVESGTTKLMTRNGHDFSAKFDMVARQLSEWAKERSMVLDGEMVVTDGDGRSDFQLLQNYVKKPDEKHLSFVVFDLLALDGKDLRALPLLERKQQLERLLEDAPAIITFSKHVKGKGKECYDAASKLGLEGIVGKRADSPYRGERNFDWVKLKCYHRQEFVIGGYTLSSKKQEGVSALLLGVYEGDKKFKYVGKAGTGFTVKLAKELEGLFASLLCKQPAFVNPPDHKEGETFFWLKPKLVAEIQYAEITKDFLLRQASFKGLREDKTASEVVLEKPVSQTVATRLERGGKKFQKNDALSKQKKYQKGKEKESQHAKEETVCGVSISNPNKIVYKQANLKKIDVIHYYEQVAYRMLQYAGERILSVVRCHKGVTGDCFFKKHPATGSEGVIPFPVTNTEGETDTYFYIADKRGLVYQAQLGTIEFHVWGSRVQTIEQPDMMVFDLDPDVGMELKQIRQGVKDLKKILDSLHLKSFLKTSGGKGYHVVVPFEPSTNWDTFYDFSKKVAELMVSKWPNRYTGNVRKQNRKGKIFIDWGRNGRGATSVAPYSLRARVGAPVSMPIAWSELEKVSPNGVDLTEALARLKKPDPWKSFYQVKQYLK